MPETKYNISFNIDGVCNACQAAEKNDNTDWDKRWKDLEVIATTAKLVKPEGHNVVVPVSGGKDSTFIAFVARELGLTPLCVNVAPCEPTPLGEHNLNNLSENGFDVIRLLPNQKIMKKLVKRSFYEDGDPCTCHEFMLYGFPARMAINFKIPLLLWGENPQFEYGNAGDVSDAQDQKNIGGLWGRDATHWVCDGVEENDLAMFQHPTAQELEDAGVTSTYLSNYVRWDSRKNARFSVKRGLHVRPQEELLGTGGYWDFEQLDDESPIIGHYLKYQKFGYGRATDQACIDIRHGDLSRDEGLAMVAMYDGHLAELYIENFCKYIGITKNEFHRVCETFYRNPVEF
jgi:N-acetyl sugar amidotransferase